MKDLFSIEGKVAIATRGSRGIGEMIAAGFLAHGARVYISARKSEVCDTSATRLTDTCGGERISLPADLSELAEIKSLVTELEKRESELDILINNAVVSWVEPLDEFPEAGWDKVTNTNLKGVFFLTQKLLPLLRKSAIAEDPARVVNIGSINGITTPYYETCHYGPSKAAFHHLTRILAARLVREHILVNVIGPGPFPSRMLSFGIGAGSDPATEDWETTGRILPRGRVGSTEDISGLAIYLC